MFKFALLGPRLERDPKHHMIRRNTSYKHILHIIFAKNHARQYECVSVFCHKIGLANVFVNISLVHFRV